MEARGSPLCSHSCLLLQITSLQKVIIDRQKHLWHPRGTPKAWSLGKRNPNQVSRGVFCVEASTGWAEHGSARPKAGLPLPSPSWVPPPPLDLLLLHSQLLHHLLKLLLLGFQHLVQTLKLLKRTREKSRVTVGKGPLGSGGPTLTQGPSGT